MFSVRRTITLCTAAIALTACKKQQPRATGMTEAGKATVTDSAKAVVQRLIDGSNKLDFAGMYNDYATEPDAKFLENGVFLPSADSIKAMYPALLANVESLENTVDEWHVLVLGPNAAVVSLPIHIRIKAKGKPEFKGQYVWSGVVQRRNQKWQIVQGHESWANPAEIMKILGVPAAPTAGK